MIPSMSKFPSSLLSITTVRILAAIICLFCITYLFISIQYPLSFKKVVLGFNLKQWKTNDTATTMIIKLIKCNDTNMMNVMNVMNHTSKLSNHSFLCDYANKSSTNITIDFAFEHHLSNALRPYCDIVPTPRNRWISAKKYVEKDIVFIIYTGASFYQNRTTAIRDTWLSRVTHKYFFSSTPYPSLPVTVIQDAGEDYMSNMKKLYQGMQIAYKEHNTTAKFYFLAGCDTFVNVPHLLKRLDLFNYTEPLVIGGYPFSHLCYKNRSTVVGSIQYPSGGAGFFLSSAMMKMMHPKLDTFFKYDWPVQKLPYSDVALNCLAHSFGIRPSFVPGFWAFTPQHIVKGNGRAELHADPEPNTFHYVSPDSMYILDEFYVFQLIDRLSNDNKMNELVRFTRQFVIAHYELLRIKKTECTLPPVKSR